LEYVFGTQGEIEVLKTKGDSHTDLTGFHQIEQTFPDQTITDNFRVVRKIESAEDVEGNCYDWYEIDRHYRAVDKTGSVIQQVNESTAALEDALCEQDELTGTRMSEIEDAMCEQDEMNDERMSAIEDAVCELDSLVSTLAISEGGTN
jgi:hypothetical protein